MRWRGLRTAILAAAYALTCTGMLAALPPAPAAAAAPVISISPVSGTFYTNPCNTGVICLGSPATVLSGPQAFPVIDFNPPSGAVPCSPAVSVDTVTQPFTDVVLNPDGTCTLIQVNNGGGPSPGPGSTAYAPFQAVFTGSLTITGGSAQVTFNLYSDDGWIMGIGPDSNGQQPTFVSGTLRGGGGVPATTAIKGYKVVGAFNQGSEATAKDVTISFPEAGTYPFEADYDECCSLPESFSMNANGGVITHGSNLGLTPTTQSLTVNGSATVTAQLFNANPLGTQVTFTVTGANAQTSSPVSATSAGTASFTYTGTNVGQDTVTASASVGGQTITSTLPATVTWNPVGTSMTLNSSDNPSYAGQQVTYTATVTAASTAAGAPVGSVAFTDNGTTISGCGAVALSSTSPYTATCPVTYAAAGSHPIAAAFTPSSSDFAAPATNPSLTQTVQQVATSATLTSSANPSAVGQQVTYTATVTAASADAGAPAGSVAFTDNGTAISGCGALTLSSASPYTATCAVTYAAPGSHPISAVFTPSSAAFAAPTTNPSLTQTVQQVSTSMTLASSANPSFPGQQVTYTATVTAASSDAGAPAGSVAFTDNGTAISGCGDVALSSTSPYTATCAVTYAAPGSHPISAVFTPSSAAFAAPTTNPSLTQTVQQVSTSMTLASSANPSAVGQQVTYTATVTAASTAAGAPAGSVAFTDNGTAISGCGAVALSSASPYTATCPVTYAGPGSHAIAAAFTPSSADFAAPATNPSLTQTVQQAATSLTLTSTAAPLQICGGDRDGDDPGCAPGVKGPKEGPGKPGGPGDRDDHGPGPKEGPGVPQAPPGLPGLHGLDGLFGGPHGTVFDRVYVPSGTDVSVPGQSVTFTATVSVQAPGAGTPTGTVTFTDTTAGGSTTTLGTENLTTTGGVTSASLTTAALPPGAQTITATYGGDTNFQGSHANLTQSVEYIFVGLLPPFGGRGGVDPNRTIPVSFVLLDAGGHPVTTATATLEVNGKPAVPQGHANVGDAFRLHGIRYQYDLKLRDQGVTSGTATLTVLTSDGNTHTFTLTVRPAPKLRPGGLKGPH